MSPPIGPSTGGYGQDPYGQHQAGSAASDYEPRFRKSKPLDGEHNVSLVQWITFEVYYHSSFPVDESAVVWPYVEISENKGRTYVDASIDPFSLTIREKDGHTLWMKILKDGLWPPREEIKIRMTRPDEFGQPITKEAVVIW